MDGKALALTTKTIEKMKARTFDEQDLIQFLALTRPHMENHTVIRELTDFVFQRDRNEGAAKAFLQECKEIIEQLGKTAKPKKIEPLYSFKEIRNSVNQLMQDLGFEKVSNEVINDLLLCMISLLQGVRIYSDSGKRQIGHLSFAASSKELLLMGNIMGWSKGKKIPITFPVLSVQNNYEKVQKQDELDTPYLFDTYYIEVMNLDGKLVITFPEME